MSSTATILNNLDTIWVIHLERRAHRKNSILEQLTRLSPELAEKVKFFPAVDGNLIMDNMYTYGGAQRSFGIVKEWREPYNGKQLTKGEIGCALSHWLLWEIIAKSESGKASIILEDDIVFSAGFTDKLVNYLNYLQSDSYVDLMYLHRKAYEYKNELVHNFAPKLKKANYSHWACAYLLTQQGAAKLCKTDFANKIIPVDEFLPIAYNSSHLTQYFKYYYENDEAIKKGIIYAVAVDPCIMDLADGAFAESATVASDAYVDNSAQAKLLEIWGIGSQETSGRRRFKEFCDVYGLRYKIIGDGITWKMDMSKGPGGGQKINILKSALAEELSMNHDSMTNLIVVSDTYDVVALAPDTTILKKYNDIKAAHTSADSNTNANIIVFSAEKSCWPQANLANSYPAPRYINGKELPRYLNSGGFIGRKIDLWNILKDKEVSDWDDDQLIWTQIYLESLKENSVSASAVEHALHAKIVLDQEAQIFQTLDKSFDDLVIKYSKGVITNHITSQDPCFLHGNGSKRVKLQLNWMENYLGNHWVNSYGYIATYQYKELNSATATDLPKVFVAIFGDTSHASVFKQELDYPETRTVIKFYSPEFTYNMVQTAYNSFLQGDCDYFMVWDANNVTIQDKRMLYKLLPKVQKLGIVAPLMAKQEGAWSNYWGDVTDNGFYSRSADYFQLIRRERTGIWNCPYVSQIYIVRRDVLTAMKSSPYDYDTYSKDDCDVAFCTNMRNIGQFMYVDNLEKYGYIYNDGRSNDNKHAATPTTEMVAATVTAPVAAKTIPVNTPVPRETAAPIELTTDITTTGGGVATANNTEDLANITLFDYKTNKEAWERKYFDPRFLAKRAYVEHTEICNDAFMFPMFTRTFCNDIIAIVEKYGNWSVGTTTGDKYHDPRISNIEEYPTQDIHLNQLGLEDLWVDLINDCFSKIASAKYAPYRTKGLNIAFVVRYTPEGQRELSPHHDASTYTINIALNEHGTDYQGGGCRFIRQGVDNVGQIPGTVAIHPGRLTHYHQGLPTTGGTRYILVAFIN